MTYVIEDGKLNSNTPYLVSIRYFWYGVMEYG